MFDKASAASRCAEAGVSFQSLSQASNNRTSCACKAGAPVLSGRLMSAWVLCKRTATQIGQPHSCFQSQAPFIHHVKFGPDRETNRMHVRQASI